MDVYMSTLKNNALTMLDDKDVGFTEAQRDVIASTITYLLASELHKIRQRIETLEKSREGKIPPWKT